MAEVFRAWDREQACWCAVKVLYERYARKASARRRFVEEGRTIIELRHRNLIEAWDLIEQAHRPYLVMELAEGGSLMDWVNNRGPVPPRLAVDAALQVSKGLGAAHAKGVVHRDVKPHNILLTQRGLCKVTDFGIAQIMMDGRADIPDATLQSQGVMGTLGYMAPEQRTDPHFADVRTDIYGIGATLYTLLTGNVETNLFVAERDPQKLQGIPHSLVPVLMRATAYRIEQRYANVEELRVALFEASKSLRADPPGSPTTFAQSIPEIPPPLPPRPPAMQSLSPSSIRPARRIVRHAAPAREEEPRTRPIVVVAALIGILIGLFTLDLLYVRSHHGAALHASFRVAGVANQRVALVERLGRNGASMATLESLFATVESARQDPTQMATAVSALLTALHAAAPRNPKTGGEIQSLRDIRELEEGQDALLAAIEGWDQAAAFPCLAVCTGLTPGPP